MSDLQDKLEQFKQLGMYAISLRYGEDIGCDDSDVPSPQRRCVVLGTPVGVLGETRMMYFGTVEGFLKVNLKQKPTVLPNPPNRSDYELGGYFIWGAPDSVEKILSQPFHGSWE